jgi:pimeloyl-ACP methyl ester carboxylesterase
MSAPRPASAGERRPPPTLLVPGWSDTARAVRHARSFLLDSGWPESHVSCVEFRDRYGSNVEHAEELAAAIGRLQNSSGERSVAVVAHSMGGLALRLYLGRIGGAAPVNTAVFVATPHRGTWIAHLAWGAGGAEMRPGSGLLRDLARAALPGHVRAVCVRTPIDTRILPGSSAVLPGAPCHVVRLPTHPRMLRHRGTLHLIRDLLLT